MPNFNTATILDIQNQSNHFYLFTCQAEQPFTFIPGQYLVVRVNPARVVQYSIASPPHSDNQTFQLLIQYIPGGEGSDWARQLQLGDQFKFLGPLGIFTFNSQAQTRELLFVATGSGIAPFLSIIPDLLLNQKESRPIRLYWGLRFKSHLMYKEQLEQLQKEFSNFTYTICISQPDQTCKSSSGRVTHFIAQDITDAHNHSAYLCGSEVMIQEVSQLLETQRISSKHIHSEKFW